MDRTILPSLRDLLAKLYTDERAIRRVADDAGLDATRLPFDGSARDIWHAILREAEYQHKTDQLLAVVDQEYGNYREFQALDQRYRQASRSEQSERHTSAGTTKQRSRVIASSLALLLILIMSGIAWYQSSQSLDVSSSNTPSPKTIHPSSTFTETVILEGMIALTPIPADTSTSAVVEQSKTVTSTLADSTPTRPVPTIAIRGAGGGRKISLTAIPSIDP